MKIPLFRLILLACLGGLLLQPANALSLDDLKKKLEKAKTRVEESKKKIDQAQGKVSETEEIEIGGNLISGLLGAAPLVADAELQRYVNDVGSWVALQTSRKHLPWHFGVIQSDGINAFAAPGGYIVITLGLFSLLENEAQLAGVLAHEIAHVTRKHHLMALQKTMKRDFWGDVMSRAASDAGDREKLKALINSGVQLYATGLDRRFEYDADIRGVVLMARAGYDPFAFLDVLTTIDSINPGSSELGVLLKTHPPTAERLDRLAVGMDGVLDSFASGGINRERFRQIGSNP